MITIFMYHPPASPINPATTARPGATAGGKARARARSTVGTTWPPQKISGCALRNAAEAFFGAPPRASRAT